MAAVRWRGVRVLALMALAFVLAASISAVQLIPLAEFGHEAKRWVGAPQPIGWSERVPYYVHAQYSLKWDGLAGFVTARVVPEADTTLFVGATVVLLALLGLVSRRQDPAVIVAGLLFAGGLVFALGASTPVHRWAYELLPMVDKARAPVRAIFIATFAAAWLAAFGADALMRLSRRWHVAAGVALLALVTFEASLITRSRMKPLDRQHTVCASALVDFADLAGGLRAEPGLGRITAPHDELMTSLGDLYGFDQLISFTAGVPAQLLRHAFHLPRTQSLFGVTHHVGKRADGSFAFDRRQGALPRAWVAHEILSVKSDAALQAAIENPAVDLAKTAVFIGAGPAVAACGGDAVRLSRYEPDVAVVDATLGCRGLVVLSEVTYPGWEASVDGEPADIVEAYGAFRAIVVSAGSHRIEMRYEPESVMYGGIVSMVGVWTSVGLLWFARRRR